MDWMSEAYEAQLRLHPAERRRRGAFMTPPELARTAAHLALDGWKSFALGARVPVMLDPACGTGNLLVAASELLLARGYKPVLIAKSLRGVELQADALHIACTRLTALLGAEAAVKRALANNLRVGDATRVPEAWLRCDVVIANPPFLGQLKRGTAIDRATATRWRARFGDAVRGYADPAAAFLLLIAGALRKNGSACVILPRSMLAAASAQPIREAVDALVQLDAVWMDDRFAFDAGTRVCALVLSQRADAAQSTSHALSVLGEVQATLPWQVWRGRWSAAAAASAGVPALEAHDAGVIGDMARATADFRDQFYGLRGTLCDDRHAGHGLNAVRPRTATIDRRASRMDRLPVLTTGLIGWNRSHWGERPARILGRSFQHPAARVPAILSRAEMRSWLSDMLHPKILIATQTPVIEAVVDARGELASSVPVIRLLPHEARDVWLLAAALLAPATSAVAWWRHAGAGLSPRAIKLSAKQISALPLPCNRAAWRSAAHRLHEAHEARTQEQRVHCMQRFMQAAHDAYAVPKDRRIALSRWWQPRAWGTFAG